MAGFSASFGRENNIIYIWLYRENGERWEDLHGGPTTLHAHSRDAAQQGFYKACKTAKACKQAGLDTKYPYHQKRWRATIWKRTGIRLKNGTLLLARAKGLPAVNVPLPSNLLSLPQAAFLEARLVWDRAARHYQWHLVVDDGTRPSAPASLDHTAAIDLGEIHPAAVTDGKETVIITCRALRSNQQYTAKRLAEIRVKTGPEETLFPLLETAATPQEPVSRQTKAPGAGYGA